jgi:transmembrane sensor
MSNPRRIGRLLYRKSLNVLIESEEKELTVWRKESPENEQLFRDKMDPEEVRSSMIRLYEERDLIFEKIKKRVPELADAKLSNQDFSDFKQEVKYIRMSPLYRILQRATLGLIVLSVILVILLRACGILHKTVEGDPDAVFVSPEGIENAGDEWNLGLSAGIAGITAERNQIGDLDYYASSKNRDKKLRYTVATAHKGNLRHARLILADSTWIWLNISTWIKYPRNFSQDTIHIILDGEAYIEGKRDSLHPYIISILPIRPSLIEGQRQLPPTANRQLPTKLMIEASTAHFDVKSYSDSLTTSITAMTGNIFIRMESTAGKPPSRLQLFAGQQAELKDGKLNVVENVDINKILTQAKWYAGK